MKTLMQFFFMFLSMVNPVNYIVSQNPFAGRARGSMMNFVATTWKGLNVLKGKALSIANPQTTLQQTQRQKFTLIRTFASHILGAIQIGFKNLAVHQSEYNAFISRNIQKVYTGTYPNLALDPAVIDIADGSLEGSLSPTVSSPNPGNITVEWTDNSGEFNALATDNAIVVITDTSASDLSTKVKAIIQDNSRDGEKVTYDLGQAWGGVTVAVYLFFVSADGQLISDSEYLGTQVITSI